MNEETIPGEGENLKRTATRRDPLVRTAGEAAKRRAVPPLRSVWKGLREHWKLGQLADVQSGIKWPSGIPDDERYSDRERPGFLRGYGRSDFKHLSQYSPPAPVFLNVPTVNGRGSAERNERWKLPKVFVKAMQNVRESRWRCVAILDDDGLIASEDLLAVWPKDRSTTIEILAAILNGPVASAFIEDHAGRRVSKAVLKSVPLPVFSDEEGESLLALVRSYRNRLGDSQLAASDSFEEAGRILLQIDGIILKGYDLAPHLERKLLDFFDGSPRPVPFTFTGYDLETFLPVRILGDVENPAEQWESLNRRRRELIEKEADVGLSEDERSELERIQRMTGRYFNTVAPLPFDRLEQFEERARLAGICLDEDEAPRP